MNGFEISIIYPEIPGYEPLLLTGGLKIKFSIIIPASAETNSANYLLLQYQKDHTHKTLIVRCITLASSPSSPLSVFIRAPGFPGPYTASVYSLTSASEKNGVAELVRVSNDVTFFVRSHSLLPNEIGKSIKSWYKNFGIMRKLEYIIKKYGKNLEKLKDSQVVERSPSELVWWWRGKEYDKLLMISAHHHGSCSSKIFSSKHFNIRSEPFQEQFRKLRKQLLKVDKRERNLNEIPTNSILASRLEHITNSICPFK